MKIIYIDLDGVVADFEKGRRNHPLSTITPYIGRPDKLPGVYEHLEPISDAIAAVNLALVISSAVASTIPRTFF